MKTLINFFDKLEDRVRGRLSKYPIIYAFFGGAGVIIFWRGVWHLMDYCEVNFLYGKYFCSSTASLIIGMTVLLVTGLFVSVFIGDSILLSGLRHEKKVTEKTEEELEEEIVELGDVLKEVKHIEKDIHNVHKEIHK